MPNKTIAQYMLKARSAAGSSNCEKRKIGVFIPTNCHYGPAILTGVYGYNSVHLVSHCCGRSKGMCPATHAEVAAIINLHNMRYDVNDLFIWAEVPCHACLSFIRRYSFITNIYCLDYKSYGTEEYSPVLKREEEIKQRLKFARDMHFTVIQLTIPNIIDITSELEDNYED